MRVARHPSPEALRAFYSVCNTSNYIRAVTYTSVNRYYYSHGFVHDSAQIKEEYKNKITHLILFSAFSFSPLISFPPHHLISSHVFFFFFHLSSYLISSNHSLPSHLISSLPIAAYYLTSVNLIWSHLNSSFLVFFSLLSTLRDPFPFFSSLISSLLIPFHLISSFSHLCLCRRAWRSDQENCEGGDPDDG